MLEFKYADEEDKSRTAPLDGKGCGAPVADNE